MRKYRTTYNLNSNQASMEFAVMETLSALTREKTTTPLINFDADWTLFLDFLCETEKKDFIIRKNRGWKNVNNVVTLE